MSKMVHILIVGAGPSGALLAIALAKLGIKVTLNDPKSIIELSQRSRAYALTQSSRILLEKLDLWQSLKEFAYPFNKVRVSDLETNISFNFSSLDFFNHTYDDKSVGWIIDHKHLMKIILSKIINDPTINVNLGKQLTLTDSNYDLVIAADGSQSSIRKQLNIKCFTYKYSQSCLTAKVLIESESTDVAYELFRHEGPLALLPMQPNLYQVVWSARYSSCISRSRLRDIDFLNSLNLILPRGLTAIKVIDPPSVFSLYFSLAKKLSVGNTFLLGESAHSFHPVAGQGLNICWRDIDTLYNKLRNSNNDHMILDTLSAQYKSNRLIDLIIMGTVTDLLVRLFSNKNIILISIRSFFMILLKKLLFARRIALMTMSYGPIYLAKSSISHFYKNDYN